MSLQKKNSLICLALQKYLHRDTILEIIRFYSHSQYLSLIGLLNGIHLFGVCTGMYSADDMDPGPFSTFISEYENTRNPKSFDKMSWLEIRYHLDVVPPEISLLEGLTSLSMRYCQLNEIFGDIGSLQELLELNLGGNNLTNIPSEIGLLQKLMKLDLRANYLTNMPSEICLLQKLTKLDLSANSLSNLPNSICNLSELRTLNLEYNKFQKVPAALNKMTSTELYLLGNPLIELPLNLPLKSYPSPVEFYMNQLFYASYTVMKSRPLLTYGKNIIMRNDLSNLYGYIIDMDNVNLINLVTQVSIKLSIKINNINKFTNGILNILNKLRQRRTIIIDTNAIIRFITKFCISLIK